MSTNSNQFNEDENGQLILVGAITLATLLVVLVLILNGVLYTENVSTREQPQSIDRGVDLVSTTEQASSNIVALENDERYEEEGQAAENVSSDLENIGQLLNERQFEAHGELIDVDPSNVQNAWVITQDEEAEFTPSDQPLITVFEQWEVATGDGIRNGSMTVTDVVTFDTSEESQSDEVFRMDVTGDDGQWSIWIFDHPTESGIGVTDQTDSDGNPDLARACTSNGVPAEIDFVTMTVDGEQCDFSFAEDVGDGPYQLDFNRGEDIQGTYEFTIGKGEGAELGSQLGQSYVLDTTDGQDGDPEEPTAYDGVYSVTTTLTVTGEDSKIDSRLFTAPHQPATTESGEKP